MGEILVVGQSVCMYMYKNIYSLGKLQKKGGGVKGRVIKEKITLFYLTFFPTFQRPLSSRSGWGLRPQLPGH